MHASFLDNHVHVPVCLLGSNSSRTSAFEKHIEDLSKEHAKGPDADRYKVGDTSFMKLTGKNGRLVSQTRRSRTRSHSACSLCFRTSMMIPAAT